MSSSRAKGLIEIGTRDLEMKRARKRKPEFISHMAQNIHEFKGRITSKYSKDFKIQSSDQSPTPHGMYRTLLYTPIYR